jgi:PTH2 family peptidyl-tRNA hydrolase
MPEDNIEKPRPKLIIVMRTDLSMRRGKQIAQGAHAAMNAIFDKFEWRGPKTESVRSYDPEFADSSTFVEVRAYLDEATLTWIHDRLRTKICVAVSSEQELVEIYERAKSAGLPCTLIEDQGLTEFHGVVTKTCCAIGPAWPEKIDPITGHLKPL